MPLETPRAKIAALRQELEAMRNTIRLTASAEDLLPPHPRPKPYVNVTDVGRDVERAVRALKNRVSSETNSCASSAESSRDASPCRYARIFKQFP